MPLSGSYFYPQMNRGQSVVDSNSQVISNSSSFLGNSYVTLLGPLDIGKWNNFTITLINNGLNTLQSGSVEVSPNGSNWEVIDNAFFAGLTAGSLTSSIYAERSYKHLRVRGITSGSGGAFTGSIDAYISLNNG